MRPTRVEISLDAIAHNAARLHEVAGGELCAVVKADAYGHGAVAVAKALRRANVPWLAVALVEEASVLREAGVDGPLLILGGDYRDAFEDVVSMRLTPMVGTRREVDGLERAARALRTKAVCHIEVDTGMSRLGVQPKDAVSLAEYIVAQPNVELTGLMTHFSHADVLDGEISRRQTDQFEAVWQRVAPLAPSLRHRHLVSSGALGAAPFASKQIVRCGLAVYGIEPVPQAPLNGLEPALRWVTRPISLRTVEPGETVSYRGRWRAPRPSRLATLPVGYADGYPRLASNRAQVLCRGRRVPVVGAVCMDLLMVDVTDIDSDQAPIGLDDEVVLIGTQQNETISAHELGTWAETIAYEIIAGIGPRTPRHYRGLHAA